MLQNIQFLMITTLFNVFFFYFWVAYGDLNKQLFNIVRTRTPGRDTFFVFIQYYLKFS